MTVDQLVRRACAQLPAGLEALARERLTIITRPRPAPDELELGVRPEWRGAFLGVPYDHETAEGKGEVLLYTGNMRGEEEIEEVLYHELMHFLGADEDDVDEAGFGEHMGLAERAA